MPIIESIKRISPLDLNKNVKIGVAFPLDEENMFEGTQTVKEQVKSNLLNVLLTEKGERVNEPNFGVGLKSYLFEPNIDINNLETVVKEQVSTYIPEIVVDNIFVGNVNEDKILYMKINYRFLPDNSEDSIRMNFR